MNLSPGTTQLTRDEKILALSIMIEQLKAEKRIEEWTHANPDSTIWFNREGRLRVCTVIRDGRPLIASRGATDEDARAQAFSVIFANEAAAGNE